MMTMAERAAFKQRVKDLVKQGVDRVIAEAMAQAEIRTGVIRPVVR